MNRFGRIVSVTFDGVSLPLPLSARVGASAAALPAAGQNDAFATSVELATPAVAAEVRLRGTSVAETLALGRQGLLEMIIAGAMAGQPGQRVAISDAVLVGVELDYAQASLATAVLRFVAEAKAPTTDPFSAEDSQ